jgi:hypothetical protein
MELRKADPASLKLNPGNPRRTAAPTQSDEQLAANVKECGLIQPPLTFEEDGVLTVIAGSRRVKACIMAGLAEIDMHKGRQQFYEDEASEYWVEPAGSAIRTVGASPSATPPRLRPVFKVAG